MSRKRWKSISMVSFLFVITFSGEASFSQKLRNMAAVVGSKIKISCVSNSSERVYWYRVKNKVTDAMKKINNASGIILPDFSNFLATGEITGETLETNSIRSENAGLLQCKTAGKEFDAQLTVLDTYPTCNVILVSREIPTLAELYCSVGFSGFWPPTMEWIRIKDNTKIDGHLNITANKVTLTMQINANNTDISAEYYCRTFFSNETRPDSGAANIPDYNYLCSPTNNMDSTSTACCETLNTTGANNMESTSTACCETLNTTGGMESYASFILAILLFISISVTIAVIVRYTVWGRKRQAQNPVERSTPAHSLVNVESLPSTSSYIGPELTATSMSAYENAPYAIKVAEERTHEEASSEDKYSSLVKSEMAPPRLHIYETINNP